jgi:hypothetical protein
MEVSLNDNRTGSGFGKNIYHSYYLLICLSNHQYGIALDKTDG